MFCVFQHRVCSFRFNCVLIKLSGSRFFFLNSSYTGIPERPEKFQEYSPAKMEAPPGTSGEGTGGSQLGRGATRGRRVLTSELVTRPEHLVSKKGISGTEILMQTNYFKLVTTTDWDLYQYKVEFFPNDERTAIRKGLVKSHKDTLGPYVFDGNLLYSIKRIEQLEIWSKRISDGADIKIVLRYVGDMQKGDYGYLQFFNIIMRRCLELLKLQIVGRDYYDANDKIDVQGQRMELWPGYLTSIRQHENDILMCAEITHKVMRQQTVLDILNDCFRKNNDNYKKEFESLVLGLVVLTDYNNHTYRISDIDYKVGPDSTFLLKNGDPITYRDYYKSKYRITIREKRQPLLVTRARPRDRRSGKCELIYLVPELCRATGLTDKMRENFGLMRSLADFTRVSPNARMTKLMEFNKRLLSEPAIKTELDQWNLKLSNRLLDIPARVLDAELIYLGNNCSVTAGKGGDWTRQLHRQSLFNPKKLRLWAVIYAHKIKDDVQNFVHLIKTAASGMGSSISQPKYYEITDERSSAYPDFLENILGRVKPELVLCVVPNNRSDRYSAIKKKCIVDRHTPSQVFLEKNLTNKNVRTIATKVAIQMNCKLGGSPWSIELPDIDLMVVGFDVCHDTSNKTRDYGAMVASLDKGLTRYYSVTSAHNVGQELSNKFATNLDSALKAYRRTNCKFPSFIVFYRDGVGEGQVPYVMGHEIAQIRDKLKAIHAESGLSVKFAFLIVTKRINTRIFNEKKNPPPGTVIDDVVTNPLRYDFFIVSQNVRQGTVTPCAYHVVADTTGWLPDQMQRLTYKLCHMYYNWSGTVRVPAPCQYAHKLAFLVAQFLRQDPSHHMEEILYYL
ncbi:piwi-like protein Siwi isoform X1 [Bombus huntii]|uniref:piwi-like protein Siwi isoform X1 n=2 Tax=Bombus huntii TaxID=85661 RepID=UPI0021A9E4DC|nr:piwi-like protein Siwi isoform X1 [Bombus huntii]